MGRTSVLWPLVVVLGLTACAVSGPMATEAAPTTVAIPVYAAGSLRAARFLADKPAGLYDMQDVLGLR